MAQLLIVYHSKTGGSRQMAEAAAAAARAEVTTVLKSAGEAGPDDVLSADGYILCAPENLAAIAGVMKDFFDRSYYPCLDRTEGLPHAIYIRAGLDGTGTRTAMERIITGLRWKAVQEPLVLKGDFHAVFEAQCRELGATMAAGLELGVL